MLSQAQIPAQDQLTKAVLTNNLQEVQRLLSVGVDANVRDSSGAFPIHLATMKADGNQPDKLAILTALLDVGADVNLENEAGNTALHIATHSLEFTKLLLSRGAIISHTNKNDETPLFAAFNYRPWSSTVVELFLNAGVYVDEKTRSYFKINSLHPHQFIHHKYAEEYDDVRKLWYAFGDDPVARAAFTNKNPLIVDGGYPLDPLVVLEECLMDFFRCNGAHSTIIRNIADIFTNARIDKMLTDAKDVKDTPHLIVAGFQGHFYPGLIMKISESDYQIIFSDRNVLSVPGSNKRSYPLYRLKVPAGKLQQVSDSLYIGKSALKKDSNYYRYGNLRLLTGNDFEIIADIDYHNFHYGRCFVENYFPIILFLMRLSLGEAEGRHLFKTFHLFMRMRLLEEYKASRAGRMDSNDQPLIDVCQAIIDRKHESLWLKHKPQAVAPDQSVIIRKQKTVTEKLKRIYQKIFYNVEDTAGSRIIAFFELPHLRKYYNVYNGHIEEKPKVKFVLDWAFYILLGLIINPVKNLIKLAVEFIPYCIQHAAKKGMENCRIQQNDSILLTTIKAAGIVALGAGYYLAKLVRVAARLVTSPADSFCAASKIHPILGLVSFVLSSAAIICIAILGNPMIAGNLAIAAGNAGMLQICHAFYVFSHSIMSTLPALVVTMAANVSYQVSSLLGSLFNACVALFDASRENLPSRYQQLEKIQHELEPARTILKGEQPGLLYSRAGSQNTTHIMKTINQMPAEKVHALQPVPVAASPQVDSALVSVDGRDATAGLNSVGDDTDFCERASSAFKVS